jgi:diaminopimelate decarboxylase
MILFQDSNYCIGGAQAETLVAKYGTPLYVYDTNLIRTQYEKLTSAFAGTKLSVKYACKALSNLNVLKYIRSLGAGLDTVSIQEILLGLHAGFTPDQIIYTPNSVGMDEIDEAVKMGVHINIDNLSVLEHFGEKYGAQVPVCIRINPHIMGGGNLNISTGHIDSKFGISIHQIRHVERIVRNYNLHVNGLHMHTGSDILDTDVFMRAADILFEQAMLFPDLEFLDFGSGFKVPYKPDDYATDVEELGSELTGKFKEFCASYGRELELWFEPGKFLVSEAGTFLVKVSAIKQTTSAVFVGVDSGLNHLIRPMFYNAWHTITNVSNPAGKLRIYTVVGNICETDTFGWDRKLNEVREGDILAFSNAGAYGFSMASNYNSRYKPAEVMVIDGEDKLITRRESFEDLIRNQIFE